MKIDIPETLEEWNRRGDEVFPGRIGARFTKVETDEICGEFDVRPEVMSWNGFLHAGSIVTLADTCCGYGALKTLPEGANGFTTIDLTSSFLGTALKGTVRCRAKPLHLGRTTQVWDATVTADTGKVIAHFRCTQMILWPKG
jgi:uncharacterized protein (TIGR00369 family)